MKMKKILEIILPIALKLFVYLFLEISEKVKTYQMKYEPFFSTSNLLLTLTDSYTRIHKEYVNQFI